MRLKSESRQGSELNGFLDSGSDVHGELRFAASFRIDGKFTGTITSDGDLIVGEGGEVEGDLQVGQVFISGTVRGTVRAVRKIRITGTGKVFADLETPVLAVDEGAFFKGTSAMTAEGQSTAGPKRVVKAAG
ncbi:MAG TPA: polymer-forming cytoskeletal protein [Thermoanaerobaculia bacterium]|nr:polymer-forming cytoskeletal protein [Thermoanaerobaculia bacterium]